MADRSITLELSKDGREYLLEKGWDPNFGARPLKRALQKYLEDPMAEEILRGEYMGSCKVEISRHPDEDRLKFNISKFSENDLEPEKSGKAE